ncbi:MAG: SBBP repeat-containing protein [Myxococcota bacterium]
MRLEPSFAACWLSAALALSLPGCFEDADGVAPVDTDTDIATTSASSSTSSELTTTDPAVDSSSGEPPSAACGNGVPEGDEQCDDGNRDESDACTSLCAPPSCSDGLRSGDESDVDCGGSCEGCDIDDGCEADADCASDNCYRSVCVTACQEWEAQFGSDMSDELVHLALGGDGSLYATGSTSGDVTGVTGHGGQDLFVAKFSAAGTLDFIRIIGSAADDAGRGVAVSDAGGIVAAGHSFGDYDGQANLGGQDGVITLLDANTNKQWSRQLGTTAEDRVEQVQFDAEGKIYVSAYTRGSYDDHVNGGSGDMLLLKLNPDGSEVWNRQLGPSGVQIGYAMEVTARGDVVVGGYSQQAFEGGEALGGSDAILAKFDPDGVLLWSAQFGGASDEETKARALDGAGNIYATGYTEGAFQDGTFGGALDAFAIKLTPDGRKLWSIQIASSGDELGYGVAVDADGDAHVVGWTSGDLGSQTPRGGSDVYLTRLSADGEIHETRLLGTDVADGGRAVRIGTEGEVYIGGWTDGDFAGTTTGARDAILMRVCPAG